MGQGELDFEEMSAHVSRGDGMPDWEKIRAEYIAGGISIRELAQKYGINRGAVGRKAKSENWAEERAKTVTKVGQKSEVVCCHAPFSSSKHFSRKAAISGSSL